MSSQTLRSPTMPSPAWRLRARGVTLLEVMAVLAVLAVLASMALPSLGGTVQRHRLAAAAEALAGDLGEARFEAVRRGQVLHVQALASAGDWCWAVATTPGCDCGVGSVGSAAPACSLKVVRSADHAGVRLLQPLNVRLDPQGGAGQSVAVGFESPRGERLRVELGALGRARICQPGTGQDLRYPRC